MTDRDLEGWTIAFDLDGTLVDSAPDLIGTLNRLLVEEGLPPVAMDVGRHPDRVGGAGSAGAWVRGGWRAGRTRAVRTTCSNGSWSIMRPTSPTAPNRSKAWSRRWSG